MLRQYEPNWTHEINQFQMICIYQDMKNCVPKFDLDGRITIPSVEIFCLMNIWEHLKYI